MDHAAQRRHAKLEQESPLKHWKITNARRSDPERPDARLVDQPSLPGHSALKASDP